MAESEGQGGKAAAGSENTAAAGKTAAAVEVIERFGGIRPMAKGLGVAVSTVQGWKERESIPSNRHDQIRAAAAKKGLTLDADLLRASAQPDSAASAPPVIDAEARPVDVAASSSSSSAPSSAAPSSAAPSSAAPSSTAKSTGKDSKESAGGSMASRASAAAQRSAKDKPADKGAPKDAPKDAGKDSQKDTKKPAAEGRRGSGGLLGGLVLGVLLALAVAVGAVYSRDSWLPLVDPQGGQQNQAQQNQAQQNQAVSEILERLEGLEGRLTGIQTDLQSAAPPPDNSAAISGLGERLTTLEAAIPQGAGQDPETRAALESLSAALARLTDRLQSVEDSQAAAGSPTEATEATAALASQLNSKLSSESARLDELLTAQSELVARLEQAERDLASATASREAAPGSEETLLLLAMLQLRDAIRGSGPYDEPLRMLQNLAGDNAALAETIAPLERRAPAGLPSLLDLQAAFPEVARRIAAIELGDEGEGWSAGVLRRLSEAVNLRPVGLVEGDHPTAVAARAEVKLNDGDLAGAVAELDALSGAAAEAAASWRGDAEARVAADQAVSSLGALVSERFRLTAGG